MLNFYRLLKVLGQSKCSHKNDKNTITNMHYGFTKQPLHESLKLSHATKGGKGLHARYV